MKWHDSLTTRKKSELCQQVLARHCHSLEPETNTLCSRSNTGFFSNCSHSLWCLLELANLGVFPRTLGFSTAFHNYKDPESSLDVYPRFFTTDDFVVESIKSTVAPYHRLRCPDHHGFYAIFPYQELNPFIRAYFSPSQRVKALSLETMQNYDVVFSNTIAICYRGTDKATEVLLADPAKYVKEALRLRKPGMRVLVQTDQEQVKRQLLESIDNSFAFEEMPTTTGKTVLHGLDGDVLGMKKLAFGERLLSTAYMLSKCRFIVNHSGNMAAWICLLRGNANGVSQFDKHGNLVGPRHILKGYAKNTYRKMRRFIRNDVSCYT